MGGIWFANSDPSNNCAKTDVNVMYFLFGPPMVRLVTHAQWHVSIYDGTFTIHFCVYKWLDGAPAQIDPSHDTYFDEQSIM